MIEIIIGRSSEVMTIVDTDLIIDQINGDENVRAFLKVKAINPCISTITEYEVLNGEEEGEEAKFNAILSKFKIYDFDQKAAFEATKIYRDLERRGLMISQKDILIAGTAIANDEVLIARDSGFKRIVGLKVITP